MYNPKHFSISDEDEIFTFLDANAFGQLVSIHEGRPTVSHLPFLIERDKGLLRCHLARPNPQWQSLAGQQLLVTFLGPHDYVSPTWYQGAGVPTWNYQAVHVYGRGRVIEDRAALVEIVEKLSRRYEAGSENPWQPAYPDSMLKSIVGVEIEIEEIQCKYKLSQNRPAADHAGVIEQLERRDSAALAAAMRKTLGN